MTESYLKKLSIVIHDLNTWGGQDRSMLEIARRMPQTFALEVFSFTVNDPVFKSMWDKIKPVYLKPYVRRPVLLKILYFYFCTFIYFGFDRLYRRQGKLILATGAISAVSDVVQVQFVQAAWNKRQMLLSPLKKEQGIRVSNLKKIYNRLLLKMNILMERLIYKPNRAYIAISHLVKKELLEEFNLDHQVHVVHHGVDPILFRPSDSDKESQRVRNEMRAKLNVPEGAVVILFVGAYERKGLYFAIEAIGDLLEKNHHNLMLVAVGSGDSEFYAQLALQRNISDKVILVDHQKDITPYYWASDIFLLPSVYEPFGLVTLEAMSCGLPPVVSRQTGASELVIHGECGLLIDDPTSATEITRHIQELLKNQDLLKTMGLKARELAESHSWDKVAKKYAQILNSIKRGD